MRVHASFGELGFGRNQRSVSKSPDLGQRARASPAGFPSVSGRLGVDCLICLKTSGKLREAGANLTHNTARQFRYNWVRDGHGQTQVSVSK